MRVSNSAADNTTDSATDSTTCSASDSTTDSASDSAQDGFDAVNNILFVIHRRTSRVCVVRVLIHRRGEGEGCAVCYAHTRMRAWVSSRRGRSRHPSWGVSWTVCHRDPQTYAAVPRRSPITRHVGTDHSQPGHMRASSVPGIAPRERAFRTASRTPAAAPVHTPKDGRWFTSMTA